jgi:hypothetical protein
MSTKSIPTTKSRKAGVKSRKATVTVPTTAEVKARYEVAIATAKAKGVKPPQMPRTKFLNAIIRAFAVASLTEVGITTGKGDAGARREFARTAKAGKVTTADVVFLARAKDETLTYGIVTDRPENTVREKLNGFCKVMGYPEHTFYAIRADKYEKGEVGQVFVVRK